MFKLVILPFLRKYWYHILLVSVTATAALAIRGCINERDTRIADRAARAALVTRDSAQVAALRDSVIVSRTRFDSLAKTLRSAFRSNTRTPQTISTVPRPSLASIKVENIQPAAVLDLCKEFVDAAEAYKLYADSTMAAQARIINNYSVFPQRKVEKSSSKGRLLAFTAGVVVTLAAVKASK